MSWLFTSASGPLLFARSYIQGCGTLGPRVCDFTSTTSPMRPASTAALASAKSRLKRRMKPSWSFTPARAQAAIMARHSSAVMAIGFSQSTCLPALSAVSAAWTWNSSAVAITTASSSGSASMAS
jgi:hypothetical protein